MEPTVLDLKDAYGLRWQLRPVTLADVDDHNTTRAWLSELVTFCLPNAFSETILWTGVMSKRGKINTAFKKRWFVLLGDSRSNYKVC